MECVSFYTELDNFNTHVYFVMYVHAYRAQVAPEKRLGCRHQVPRKEHRTYGKDVAAALRYALTYNTD